MPFPPKNNANPTGRKVGSKNKKPLKIRIENLIEQNLDAIESAMETASIGERMGFVVGLCKLI